MSCPVIQTFRIIDKVLKSPTGRQLTSQPCTIWKGRSTHQLAVLRQLPQPIHSLRNLVQPGSLHRSVPPPKDDHQSHGTQHGHPKHDFNGPRKCPFHHGHPRAISHTICIILKIHQIPISSSISLLQRKQVILQVRYYRKRNDVRRARENTSPLLVLYGLPQPQWSPEGMVIHIQRVAYSLLVGEQVIVWFNTLNLCIALLMSLRFVLSESQ